MSAPVGPDGTLLVAGEIVRFDGPWDRPDDLRKLNGVLRYSQGSYDNGFAVTAMAYSGSWYATDQIPQRAVDQGLIGRFGNIDPTDGGFAHRYSASPPAGTRPTRKAPRASTPTSSRATSPLFNNFTYFLNNPVDGDQFKQTDDRLDRRRQRQPDVLRHRPRRPEERDHDRRADALRLHPRRPLQHQGARRSSPPCATTR